MHKYTKEAVFDVGDSITIKIGNIDTPALEKEHTHEFLELIYISSGSGKQYIDGVKYDVSKGDLLFVNYGQTHSFESEKMQYVNILLEPAFMSSELIDSENIAELFKSSLFDEFTAEQRSYTCQCVSLGNDDTEAKEIRHLVEMMREECNEKRVGYRSVLHGCARILFTRLLRKLSADSSQSTSLIDFENPEIMKNMLDYIDENCFDKITLEQLAAKSFYNPSYFGRMLKRYCGKSFTQYIKEKRIEMAKELLLNTDENIESIMTSVGYRDKKLFYRHFKELLSMTPSEYREKNA